MINLPGALISRVSIVALILASLVFSVHVFLDNTLYIIIFSCINGQSTSNK